MSVMPARLADYYAENRHFFKTPNRSVMKVIVILQDGRRVWE